MSDWPSLFSNTSAFADQVSGSVSGSAPRPQSIEAARAPSAEVTLTKLSGWAADIEAALLDLAEGTMQEYEQGIQRLDEIREELDRMVRSARA